MRIEIFQDLVCPWCFIGKRRLDRALAGRPDQTVETVWRPFQLNPGIPREGVDRQAYMTAKFGGRERAARIYAAVTEAAARDGLALALHRIRRMPNTLDAHRLVRLVDQLGGDAGAVTESLYRAYFIEGRDIGDRGVLAEIGADNGLPRTEVARYLAGDEGLAAVRAADAAARRMGIQAVPCFVFDRRYALSGAQEPKAFAPLLDLAEAERERAPASSAG